MIAHVAEAGEGRGRVVLRLASSGRLSDIALEAAVRVAEAFQSEVESLFVEDRQLLDMAGFPGAREISLSGRSSRPLVAMDILREMRFVASALQRKVAAAARARDIPVRMRVLRDEPVRALMLTCRECGPWNVVTLGEPFTAASCGMISELFRSVRDTTGIVLAGPGAARTTGPVIAVVEEVERVPAMLRIAERLAQVSASEARLLVVESDGARLQWLEGQVRLALGRNGTVALDLADLALDDARTLAERLRRLGAGFVVARFGGRFATTEQDVATLSAWLEGPLFLVR
jgi:hypothetical protein